MIRQTLNRTKRATYAILLPSSAFGGMPVPNGTGFFVDETGYFLTAHHVVKDRDTSQAWLQQAYGEDLRMPMVQWPELMAEWPEFDLALLKVDFSRNHDKWHLVGEVGFPYVPVELDPVGEASPVYAFGYPLPEVDVPLGPSGGIGAPILSPRTTSAIVSSTLERTTMVRTDAGARVYVLDKALNYGNSGGPIVSTESGKAFAVCSRFQPVEIPQPGGRPDVWMPSLYGVVTSIANIADDLRSRLSYL